MKNIVTSSIIIFMLTSIAVILGGIITPITTFGQQNNVNTTLNIPLLENPNKDNTPPYVNITYPPYPPTINTGNITIRGTANDSSGIKAVNASAHNFPFNGSFPIDAAATPSLISEGNISSWSVPFMFNKTDVYRVVIAVTDNSYNTRYTETMINVVLAGKSKSNSSSSSSNTTTITRPTHMICCCYFITNMSL